MVHDWRWVLMMTLGAIDFYGGILLLGVAIGCTIRDYQNGKL